MAEGTVVFQPYGSEGRIGCISLIMGFSWNMSWNFSTGIGQLNGDWHWWLTLYKSSLFLACFASSGHNSTQWGEVCLLSETAVALIIKKPVPDLIYCQYEQDANLFFSTSALYWHNEGMIIRFSRDKKPIVYGTKKWINNLLLLLHNIVIVKNQLSWLTECKEFLFGETWFRLFGVIISFIMITQSNDKNTCKPFFF